MYIRGLGTFDEMDRGDGERCDKWAKHLCMRLASSLSLAGLQS